MDSKFCVRAGKSFRWFYTLNLVRVGKLRVCGRGFSEGKSEASKQATNFGLAKTSNFLYTLLCVRHSTLGLLKIFRQLMHLIQIVHCNNLLYNSQLKSL